MNSKKPKKSEEITLIAFRDDLPGSVFSRKISVRSIKITLLGAFFFVVASLVGFVGLFKLSSERELMLSYKLKNEQLNAKISEYAEQIETINAKVAYLEDLENKVRTLSSYNSEEIGIAVGGKEVDVLKDFSAVAERKEKQYFDNLNRTLLSLAKSIEERKNGLSELIDMLEEQKLISLATPSIMPVQGWISSKFGYRVSPFSKRRVFHEGVDIASSYGSDVVATAEGMVIYSGYKLGYGNLVTIDHGFGLVTRYAHNSKLLVKVGDRVEKGDKIAKVGNSGKSTGPHVHYEVLVNGVPVNPMKFVAKLEEQK